MQSVIWDVSNTDAAPVNCSDVDIFLSVDGGFTYPFLLLGATANDGAATVIVPNVPTTNARIKVKAANSIFFDISNEDFTILEGATNEYDAGIITIAQPHGETCGTTIIPEIELSNFGSETLTSLQIIYSISGGSPLVFNWVGSLETNETATVLLPELLVAGGDQTFNVSISDPNGETDENAVNNTLSTDFTINEITGLALPVTNDFSGVFPGTGWDVENADGGITWDQSGTITGADCNTTSAASINFYSYNESGEEDDLVSPYFDLSGVGQAELTFDYAYARYSATLFDRLQIQIQESCSEEWSTLWDLENLALATAGTQTAPYDPECADWESDLISLADYADQIVRIRFKGITGYGNNLFLDNVNIDGESQTLDCNGDPDGDAFLDECATCVGGNTGLEACVQDCAGEFGGSATTDQCGVCDANPANDNTTCLDCAGVINGTATTDDCGICDSNDENDNTTCLDCAGVINGTATTDDCGVCDSNDENDNTTCLDCAGVINGTATTDDCGICDANPANDNTTCLDCAGVINGTATTDDCGICDANPANDNTTCLDCAGVINGTATTDDCGVCDANPANDNTTCLDCAGVVNGTATTDDCGICDANPNNDDTTCSAVISGSIASANICFERDLTVRLYMPGTAMLVETIDGTVSEDGSYSIAIGIAGTYDVFVKVGVFLQKGFASVGVPETGANLDITGLTVGDFNNDNGINIADFTAFGASFGSIETDESWDPLFDLNCDGGVNIGDFTIFGSSFGLAGDLAPLVGE